LQCGSAAARAGGGLAGSGGTGFSIQDGARQQRAPVCRIREDFDVRSTGTECTSKTSPNDRNVRFDTAARTAEPMLWARAALRRGETPFFPK
jgi:hypothetical protein